MKSVQTAPTVLGDLSAEVHETHTGLVALIGDRAFKTKKPVVTDFLDFGTVDRREQACLREVELNRRLAPNSYFGVGRFVPPQPGPAEPVIVMRRYPDSSRLSTVVTGGAPAGDHLSAIAKTLARFHEHALRGHQIDEQATVAALSARWHENLDELRRHVGELIPQCSLDEITRLADQFLAGRHDLFAKRIADGRIVDGHGDLLSEDIFCLPTGPVLLDCLEFDDHLRYVDVIDDAAFLAMDLEFLGRTDLADYFLAEYARLANDTGPNSLRHFCIAYRAIVRAKVDCIRVVQGRPEAAADAHRHMTIAAEHLRSATVQLVIVGGGPGTGKTTLAHALAEQINAQVLSTDDVRRTLQQSGGVAGAVGDFDAGLYSPENVAKVYDEVLRRADTLLSAGSSVILDGTWRDVRQRERAHRLGVATSSPVVDFTLSLPVAVAAGRVIARGPSSSDATEQIVTAMGQFDQWDRSHAIDSTRPLHESIEEAERICCLAI